MTRAGRGRTGRGRTGPGPDRVRRSSLSNWSVSTRLIALFAMASVLGLVFGGLRIADAVGTAGAYSRSVQLADVGVRVTALAQAMEDERDRTIGVAALMTLQANAPAGNASSPVAASLTADLKQDNAELDSAEAITNAAAASAQSAIEGIGSGFPASIQSKAATALAQIRYLLTPGGLRLSQKELGQLVATDSTIQVVESYSGELSILFALDDEITSGSGDVQLGDDVRALSALSAAEDQASQQRAILYGALVASALNNATGSNGSSFNNVGGATALDDFGGLAAFVAAQDLQFADQQSFVAVASQAQSTAVTESQASQESAAAQLIENLVSTAADPTVIFPLATANLKLGFTDTAASPAAWYSDMSGIIGGMRTINDQLAGAIVARSQQLQHQAFESAVLTAVVTVAVVLLVLLATALVARSMVNPLRRLQTDALEIASVRLPARVAAAASGTDLAEADPASFGYVEPIGVEGTDEIARVARAFDQVHAEAVRLAGTEAQLRSNLNTMFISLSRRSVPLIDRLSRMIDNLEQNEADSEQLSHLFSMDHLVTRMRRNSENLLVLAGEEPVRKWSEPVPLGDVARAASAEIEQYGRVSLAVQPGIMVSGQAAADIVHLLAELIENATLFSPQENQIQVSVADSPGGGVLVEVRDEGVGVSATRLEEMNWRLDHPPGVDVSVSRHMGLFAVSRLAARHGIRVRLRAGNPQGLTALVWLPGNLTSREQPLSVGMHSRPRPDGSTFNENAAFGNDPSPALGAALAAAHGTSGLRQRTTGRPGGGRHRLSLLATSGDQPVVGGGAAPRSVWFAAKRRPAGLRPRRPRPLQPRRPRPARPRPARARPPARRAAGSGRRLRAGAGDRPASTGRPPARPPAGCARPTSTGGRPAARPPSRRPAGRPRPGYRSGRRGRTWRSTARRPATTRPTRTRRRSSARRPGPGASPSSRRRGAVRRKRRATGWPDSSLATATQPRRAARRAGHRTQERKRAVEQPVPSGP